MPVGRIFLDPILLQFSSWAEYSYTSVCPNFLPPRKSRPNNYGFGQPIVSITNLCISSEVLISQVRTITWKSLTITANMNLHLENLLYLHIPGQYNGY